MHIMHNIITTGHQDDNDVDCSLSCLSTPDMTIPYQQGVLDKLLHRILTWLQSHDNQATDTIPGVSRHHQSSKSIPPNRAYPLSSSGPCIGGSPSIYTHARQRRHIPPWLCYSTAFCVMQHNLFPPIPAARDSRSRSAHAVPFSSRHFPLATSSCCIPSKSSPP